MAFECSLIVWSDFLDVPKLLVVHEDWTRFDGCIINSTNTAEHEERKAEEALQDELCNLVYDESGKIKLQELTREEFRAIASEADFVLVRCGMYP